MKRMIRRGALLLAVLGLGLGLVPGLLGDGGCATGSGCPIMSRPGETSHCPPGNSFVADCCVTQNLPANSTRTLRVAVAPGEELLAVPDNVWPSFDAPEMAVARLSPLAGKLHTIGRHTLFQVFLS